MSVETNLNDYIFTVGSDLAERFFEGLPDLRWDGSVTFSYGRVIRLNPTITFFDIQRKGILYGKTNGGKKPTPLEGWEDSPSRIILVSNGEEFVAENYQVYRGSDNFIGGGKFEEFIYKFRNFPGQGRELDILRKQLAHLRKEEYSLVEVQLSTENGSHKIKLLPTSLNSHCPTELELKVTRDGTDSEFDSWYKGLEKHAMAKPVSR